MIIAKVGPAFQPPAASTDEILAAALLISCAVLTFVAAFAAVRWYAERP